MAKERPGHVSPCEAREEGRSDRGREKRTEGRGGRAGEAGGASP